MTNKKFDIEAFKASLEIPELEEKKPKYVTLNEELQVCLGLPGFPYGDIVTLQGDSDSGKSTILMHAAAQAQKQGAITVLVICEKKHRNARVEMMGFDPNGENVIINKSCKSIEDIFEFCDKVIAGLNKDKNEKDVMFFIDSIGNVNCRAAREDKKDGTTELKNVHQQNAKALSEHIQLMADKINDTRYTTHHNNIGMVLVNHVYDKPATFPGGVATKEARGGKKLKYVSSLQVKTSRTKKLEAMVDGDKLSFGFISKIDVIKNHISGVLNSGRFVITEDSIFANEPGRIEEYKKQNKEKWKDAKIIETDEHEE